MKEISLIDFSFKKNFSHVIVKITKLTFPVPNKIISSLKGYYFI